MKILNLLQTKYTEYLNQVKLYLSKTLSDYDENYGNSTVIGQLINVLGSTVQNMLLYIEDALTEQNKYTAQRKKSIYSLAQLSGYNPSLGKASSCVVKLMVQPNNYNLYSAVIPNKTKLVCSYNGLKYNIILPQEAITIPINSDCSSKQVQVVEGTFETQNFVCTGGQMYSQTVLFNSDCDIDYLEVYVNDELWERIESLYDMEPNANQYVVKTSMTKGIDLLFGNEQLGKALSANDKITVTYLLHDGEQGNINTQEDVYFSFEDDIIDASGNNINANEIFVLKLNDSNGITGGAYSETTAKVKEMIGFNSRALVLADPKNYKQFLRKFSFVGYSRTWSEEGSLIVHSIILRNYAQLLENGSDYFNLKLSDLLLTESQKNSIQQCIQNSGQQLVGVTHKIVDPKICKYACYVYLKMKDTQYDKNSVEQAIRNAIGEFFTDINSDYFIPKSNLIKVIKESSSYIDGVDLYFLSEKNEEAIIDRKYINEIYTFNPSKGTYDIKSELVYVEDGTNPGLGLDEYGNIYLSNHDEFPVLMGGWKFLSSSKGSAPQYTSINDPLTITFRD